MDTAQKYDASKYDRPSVTVDVVVFTILDDELQVLLIQRKNQPYQNMWAIPGGFVQMDEGLERAAYRELAEETGVCEADVYLEQLYTLRRSPPRPAHAGYHSGLFCPGWRR